jgi:hypothetical protein
MGVPVFILVKQGSRILVPKKVIICDRMSTFEDLAEILSMKHSEIHFTPDDIAEIVLSSITNDKEKIQVSNDSLALPVSTGLDIGLNCISFNLNDTFGNLNVSLNAAAPASRNAFTVLMSAKECVPSKSTLSALGPEKMYDELIDWVVSKEATWKSDVLSSGEKLIRCLRNCLWYVESGHDRFTAQGCPIPSCFEKFKNYRDWKLMKKKQPKMESVRLNELINELATALNMPSCNTKSVANIVGPIENLLHAMAKYRNHLNMDSVKHAEQRVANAAIEDPSTNDASYTEIHPTSHVETKYLVLDEAVKVKGLYKYIDLEEFCQEDRIERRKFLKDIKLSVPIFMYRVAYGGAIGTHSFIWGVPEQIDFEKNMQVISRITSKLPKYSKRAARKNFIEKYSKNINVPKSMLRNMFYELTGYEHSPESSQQAAVDERTAEFLFTSDDPDIILDYRSQNGKRNESKFNDFYEGVEAYFEKQLLAVQERRHGNELYLPLAVSMEDLKREVSQTLPEGTPVPSTETLRLQFHPANIYRKESVRYTGRFNVKYTVQTRMSRVCHPDAKYVATQWNYLKEFCVKHHEKVRLFCLDDKAIVPVGEPGLPISTGVRAHNRVLAPVDTPLRALDHDFHVAGIVPSVALACDIPENAKDSFFSGQPYVTIKDKIFEPSNPFRHASELLHIIRRDFSEQDDLAMDKPVLILFTDGGPDHRPTFETVKLSLLSLFIQLDLDMLIALRTAPYNSWVNLAERVMPILNLALQHCALERDKMPDKEEKKMKNKGSLSAVRNCAEINSGFQEAYTTSMQTPIKILSERFGRMTLKGANLKTSTGQCYAEIEDLLTPVKLVTGCNALNTKSASKDVRQEKELMSFMNSHSKSSQYCFQLLKCQDESCQYCSFLPRRIDDSYCYLPDPMPSTEPNAEHTYQSFEMVNLLKVILFCYIQYKLCVGISPTLICTHLLTFNK